MRGVEIFTMCPNLDVNGLIDGTNVRDSIVKLNFSPLPLNHEMFPFTYSLSKYAIQ